MKRVIKSTLCIMLLLLTSACGVNWYKEDVSQTYKDYWSYSLGKYEVSSEFEDDNGSNGSGGLTTNKWIKYTFEFKDINNNTRDITVSNYNIGDFNDKILANAAYFLEEDIEDLFKGRSIQKIEGVDTWYDIPIMLSCTAYRVNQNINLYDAKSGLKFNELSLNTLSKNNISIIIRTSVRLDGSIDDYPSLKQKLIDDVRFIFDNYEYTNIVFSFNLQPSDDWYSTDYNLSYDGHNYNWEIKYRGEVN